MKTSDPRIDPVEGGGRPEELVAEIYRQKLLWEGQNRRPSVVVLSSHAYQKIQLWHGTLGIMQNQNFEYISRDRIFGLEFCLDNSCENPKIQ